MPGVAEYAQQGTALVPRPPSPEACAPGAGGAWPLVVLGVVGAGAAAYFLLVR